MSRSEVLQQLGGHCKFIFNFGCSRNPLNKFLFQDPSIVYVENGLDRARRLGGNKGQVDKINSTSDTLNLESEKKDASRGTEVSHRSV